MRNIGVDSNLPQRWGWLYFIKNKWNGPQVNSSQQEEADLIWIYGDQSKAVRLPFECQPLFTRAGEIHGQELLYRGLQPASWPVVDAAVLKYLARHDLELPRVFVNLANESLLEIPDEALVVAAQVNRVVFELSEQYFDGDNVAQLVAKVDRLVDKGVKFAIDDFGGGYDGLRRLYSLAEISYVKVDGAFLRTCLDRSDAAGVLTYLVRTWQSRGINVVAEWVESPSLLAFAKMLDFDLTQGWYVDELYRTDRPELRIA